MPRPVSTLVFGILNLVFGVLGLLGLAMTLAMVFMPQPKMPHPNPILEMMHKNAAYAIFLKSSVALGLAAAVVLILAGVGLLCLKSWGRSLSIGYAVYAVVAGIVGVAANFYFFMPLLEKASHMPAGPEQAGLIGGVVGGTIGGCVGLIYPVLLLFFMFRPNVVAAMRPACCAEIVAD